MPSRLINRDKHRVALFGVEYLGGYKAGAYIAKNSGDMLHTGVLRKSLNIAALHTLCCRVGGCRAHTPRAGNRGDNGDMRLVLGAVPLLALYIV